MAPVKRLLSSTGYLFEGFRLLKEVPGLFAWALIPFLIDLFLIFFFMGWAVSSLSGWITSALALVFSDPSGILYSLLYYPLYLILGLGFIVISIYGVFLISTVVASPFNSVLAEKTLSHLQVIESKPFKFADFMVTSLRMMLVSFTRALLFGVFGIFIWILSFVPVLNIGASFGAFVIIAFDSMDYSYESLEWNLRRRLAHFKASIPEFSGMALVMGLTLLLPGLTLLVLPLSVIGAASVLASTQKSQN